MDEIERRAFIQRAIQGATIGALAFAVGGVEVLLTPKAARAQGVPLRDLTADEAATLEALGDTLAIDARKFGIAHFVDQQLAQPPGHALLTLRLTETRPPYVNFYRAALAGIERASLALHNRKYAELGAEQQADFVTRLRQAKLDGWQGPPQGFVYGIIRNDALDVVYGTMEGFERINFPYMAHIAPERSW
jgi:hypothetical protein